MDDLGRSVADSVVEVAIVVICAVVQDSLSADYPRVFNLRVSDRHEKADIALVMYSHHGKI
jgi:hypothetical protein